MIPVMGLSLVSVECHGFYDKPIEIFKISGITLLGGLLWSQGDGAYALINGVYARSYF